MRNLTIEELNAAVAKIRDLSEMQENEQMSADEIIDAMHEEMNNINYSFVTINEDKMLIEVIPAYEEIFCFAHEDAYSEARSFILNNSETIPLVYTGRFKELQQKHYLLNNTQLNEIEKIFDKAFI